VMVMVIVMVMMMMMIMEKVTEYTTFDISKF